MKRSRKKILKTNTSYKMSNNNILKAGLKSMGIDVDKLPKDKIEPILQLADSISDPEKMTPQQIQKLQNLLGVTQTTAGIQSMKRVPHRRNKIGPNQKCPCGGGKKYKKCCGANKKSANQVRK